MNFDELVDLIKSIKDIIIFIATAYFVIRFMLFIIFGVACATSEKGTECISTWLLDFLYWIFGPLFLAANISNIEPIGGIVALVIIIYWGKKWLD